jgi:hypothetical protein
MLRGVVRMQASRLLRRWLGILYALPLCASWGCAHAPPWQQYVQPTIAVSPNVQVSVTNANLEHRETLIAADPANRAQLIACVVVLPAARNGSRTMVYRSHDGGSSWVPALGVGDANYNSNDPTCLFGPRGRAYFGGFTYAWASGLPTKLPQGGFVYASVDGGRTWSRPTLVGFGDRPFLAADNSSSSRFFGRVYADSNFSVSNRQTHRWDDYLAVFTSLDEGRTFGKPVLVSTRSGRGEVWDGNCATTTRGVLACVFLSPKKSRPPNGVAIVATSKLLGNAFAEVAISHNGGATFTRPILVSDAWMLFPAATKTSVIPYIAADDSSGGFKDRLYVVWPDVRSGRSEILLSYSSDNGQTWSRPLVVNDDNANGAGKVGPDDFQPSIAVNDRGVVGITWFDRRDILDDLGWRVRFTASLDGGKSVLPSIVVSTAPQSFPTNTPWRLETDEPLEFRASRELGQAPAVGGAAFFNEFGGGDTAGLTADTAGLFHTLWIDNRTGVPQMWTATISVKPAVPFVRIRRFADRHARLLRPLNSAYTHLWKAQLDSARVNGLASSLEVTDGVDLSLMNARFDPNSRNVSVDAVLTNVSRHSLPSPLELELTSVSSAVGRPSLPSAILTFHCSSRLKRLAPGQSTAARHIVVRLSNIRPLAARDLDYVLTVRYLILQGRVFTRGAP